MNAAALTNAWLDAVFRTRSAAYQQFTQEIPQAKPSRTDRTLSDTIESGLQDAGAKPLPTINQVQPGSASDGTSSTHIDRLA